MRKVTMKSGLNVLVVILGILWRLCASPAIIMVGTGYECQTIAAGVEGASFGDTVLIAPGTYYESDLQMKEGLSLKAETPGSVTVDGEGKGNPLIRIADKSRVEGLTLTGGENAIQAWEGGEFYVANCTITLNDRTGISCSQVSTPHVFNTIVSYNGYDGVHFDKGGTLEGCVITDNGSDGVYTAREMARIRNTIIARNGQDGLRIGTGGRATMINCLVVENARDGVTGKTTLIGCTVAYNLRIGFNTSEEGDWYIVNTIIFGNISTGLSGVPLSKTSHSLVQDNYGNYAGKNGNIWANPYFFNPVEGDFSLWWDSPCVDAGKWQAELTASVSRSGSDIEVGWSTGKDLAGNERLRGGAADMGAYEYQGTPPTFAIEASSDLITWQEVDEVSGFNWMEPLASGVEHRFYRVVLPE